MYEYKVTYELRFQAAWHIVETFYEASTKPPDISHLVGREGIRNVHIYRAKMREWELWSPR